jgi:hypothetical protein
MTFTTKQYGTVLDTLIEHYGIENVRPACPPWPSSGALLRHDVDLMLTPAILRLAEVEEERGVRSCWFIRVDGHYNPLSEVSRDVLTRLTTAGHRIGLHYDCASVSIGSIFREQKILHMACPISNAITGHRPTLAAKDPFRFDWRNPGSIVGHGYAADSRRVPLELPDPLPPVLQVNTHPEHYVTDLPLEQHYEALREELSVSLAA